MHTMKQTTNNREQHNRPTRDNMQLTANYCGVGPPLKEKWHLKIRETVLRDKNNPYYS